MVFLISYDLHRPRQEYAELYEKIKKLGAWWHHLDSVWIVDTELTPSQIWNRLSTTVDKDDSVLVIRVTDNPKYKGWLPKDAWNWLNNRMF